MFDPYKVWEDIQEECHPCSTQFIGPFMFSLVGLTGAKATAEIGIFKGYVSMSMMAAVKRYNGVHHAIDVKKDLLEHLADLAFDNGFDRNLLLHHGDSATMDLDVELDVLHIDGLHTYAAVKADIETWVPRVKPGGYVCFHDYLIQKAGVGVKAAVDEALTDEFEHILLDYSAGSMLWRRKK